MIEIKVVRNVILNNIDFYDHPSRMHRSFQSRNKQYITNKQNLLTNGWKRLIILGIFLFFVIYLGIYIYWIPERNRIPFAEDTKRKLTNSPISVGLNLNLVRGGFGQVFFTANPQQKISSNTTQGSATCKACIVNYRTVLVRLENFIVEKRLRIYESALKKIIIKQKGLLF